MVNPIALCLLAVALFYAKPAHAVKAKSTKFVRANHELQHMTVDPKSRFLAYVDGKGMGLYVLDLRDKKIYTVTKSQVGASFFWSPDGYRLFFREASIDKKGAPLSTLKAYDCVLHRSVAIDSLPLRTGYLTFDPRTCVCTS